ncbi:hypothetical protein DICVIV_13151 [Dictyocaulus viviparus]|uniref:Secreted protein n=1 Tax=Dictyocaulus viviparus TaxID=29172 RepID=A0A0D8XB55_DICVI|nr:hypothetical protein DICVIV_13151 [Dictyocaulus viviparus]
MRFHKMQQSFRWPLLALILVVLSTIQTQASYREIDRVLGGRIERNCFFSPMGCMFLPSKKFSRVRRLPFPREIIPKKFWSGW